MTEPATRGRRASAGPGGRLHGIDVWRGVILCTIFVNHVPGTVFERLTFKNFGFSDASEAFVFIAGLSLAFAYGRRLAAKDDASIVAGLARRAVKLYGVHIGLSLAGLAVYAAGAALTEHGELMQQHGRDLVVDDPAAALVGLFSLGHQFGYFNILPMYVVLMGLAPALLLVARFRPTLMLALSFGLYALSRLADVNVPTWPMSGAWFFDPFAWQALMAVGIVVGLKVRSGRYRSHPLLLALASAVLVAGVFCATDGLGAWSGLADAVRPLVDLDKTMLGFGRLAHSLSLAYVIHGFGLTRAVQATWLSAPLSLVGQNGLAMFGLSSILSAAGQVATEGLGHSLPLDSCIVGGGLAVMILAARLLDRRKAVPSRSLAANPLAH